MKELINFINGNKYLSITVNTTNRLRMWGYGLDEVGFFLDIDKDSNDKYKCSGAILIGYDFETELISISKILNSEKEVINLIEEMSNTSTDIWEFIKNKRDSFNN